MPRLSKVCTSKRGKPAPASDRRSELAATADAALSGSDQALSAKEFEVNKAHLQHKIRIDDVIEALQEDAEDAKSSQNSRSDWRPSGEWIV